MRRSIPEDFFQKIKFSTIGLGDSSYDKYNFIAKKLHKRSDFKFPMQIYHFYVTCNIYLIARLIQLKGEPVLDVCLCDDQANDGIEGSLAKWTRQFWFETFDSDQVSSFQKISATKKDNIILKYKTQIHSDLSMSFNDDEQARTEVASEARPFYAKLTMNQRVTSDEHWQNTRLLEFDVSDIQNANFINYEAGDVLMLLPSNFRENVKKFYEVFAHLNLENLSDKRIEIALNLSDKDLLFTPSLLARIRTVGDLVEKYFDLNSQPRMSFFEIFARLATDALEKEKLEEFISSDDGGEGNAICLLVDNF